jgi:hypothetical protein
MPEFKADLLARLLIKVAVNTVAVTTIDRSGVARELFVTLAGVGCTQFMKTLQPVFMQRFAGEEHGLLQERGVAFVSATMIAFSPEKLVPENWQVATVSPSGLITKKLLA